MDAYEQEQADRTMLGRYVPASTLDMSARYSVAGYGGIAFYLTGYATETTDEEWVYDGEGDPDDDASYLYSEPEKVENRQQVRAIMVGDDREFIVDVDDLTVIGEDDYCPSCGQTGCGWH